MFTKPETLPWYLRWLGFTCDRDIAPHSKDQYDLYGIRGNYIITPIRGYRTLYWLKMQVYISEEILDLYRIVSPAGYFIDNPQMPEHGYWTRKAMLDYINMRERSFRRPFQMKPLTVFTTSPAAQSFSFKITA